MAGDVKKKRKLGAPTKATPKLIQAVLSDLAIGLTREWACAKNGVSLWTWNQWERRDNFSQLRARAIGIRVAYLLDQIEKSDGFSYKKWAWMLERTRSYEDQFTDPSKPMVAIQNNMVAGAPSAPELDEVRRNLDLVSQREQHRLYGPPGNITEFPSERGEVRGSDPESQSLPVAR